MADYKKIDLQIGTEEQFEEKKLSLSVGTLVGITDPIHESELDTDLQTKINDVSNKLTAPTTPTTESAVTMLTDGTVGTKPLSEIGGGKLYLHHVQISIPSIISIAMSTIYINIYSNNSTEYTKNTIPKTAYSATILSGKGNGTIYLSLSSTNAFATGVICQTNGNIVAFNSSNTGDSTWDVIQDMITEL